MKHLSLIALLTLVPLAYAFDIPKGSHHIGQIDDVSKKAAKAKQPVAFVISKKKLTAT